MPPPPTAPATLAHISRYRPSRAEAGESQYLHFLGGFLGTRVLIKMVGKPESMSPGPLSRLRRHALETIEKCRHPNATHVSECEAAADRHEDHAWLPMVVVLDDN